MNKHHAERAYLLYLTKSGISNARRPAGPITPSDYSAVYTPPTNNPIPFYGPCLIWRHRLDADGYGTLRLDGKTLKAHRAAYEMTRGSIPEGKFILHMCHRRSCIQPAHLYAGTRKQNADDRQTRLTEKGRWAALAKFFEEYESRMFDALKYQWDEPPEIERTLFQQQTGRTPLRIHHPRWRAHDTRWQGRRNKTLPDMLHSGTRMGILLRRFRPPKGRSRLPIQIPPNA